MPSPPDFVLHNVRPEIDEKFAVHLGTIIWKFVPNQNSRRVFPTCQRDLYCSPGNDWGPYYLFPFSVRISGHPVHRCMLHDPGVIDVHAPSYSLSFELCVSGV